MTEPSPACRGAGYWLVVAAGLGVLVGANYYLRSVLENADQFMFNFYRYFYPEAAAVVFGPDFPKWRLLLPFAQMTGSWSPAILVLTHYVSDWLGPAVTWYVTNAAMIVISFLLSWSVFRSRVFSFTLAICLGFGTHLYYAYPNSGLIGFPLYYCYLLSLLLCAYRVVMAQTHRRAWKAAFAAALVVTALGYETWLDFMVFSWVAGALFGAMLWRRHNHVWLRRLAGVVAVITAAGLVYVYIKVTRGYGQHPGMETDLVFNYPYLAPAVEEVISNHFMNLYMALSNFLPPFLVSSTAFYQLGGDRLVELQHGYHAPFTYLVPMQALFMWRYYAGVAATLFALACWWAIKRAWVAPTPDRIAAVVFLLMIAIGGPTHTFIKARPFNSMAVQTYHVWVPVLGVSLLISLLVMLAWRSRSRWRAVAVVAGAWAVIFYGALARPEMISHQAAQSGLGVRVYPNPLATLKTKLGMAFTPAGGLEPYQLRRLTPGDSEAPVSGPPPLMPDPSMASLTTRAPALDQWLPASGVSVEAAQSGWRVTGNDTEMGYQLVSPVIEVPAQQLLLVRTKGVNEAGRVCLGILKGDETAWIVPAEPNRTELAVNTAANTQIKLVFANCMTATTRTQSRFSVYELTYGVVQVASNGGR